MSWYSQSDGDWTHPWVQSPTPNEEKKPWDPQLVDSSASKRGARPRTRKICRWSEVDWSSTCTACCYTWGNKILFLFSPLPAWCRNCHERHESWHFLSRKYMYTIHFWKVTPKTWTKLLQWATFQSSQSPNYRPQSLAIKTCFVSHVLFLWLYIYIPSQ